MSTPEAVKTRGTFFPAAEATTPRRSPRLAARRLHQRAEAPGATVSTPVRGALRDCIRQRERGGASLFDEVETVVKSQFRATFSLSPSRHPFVVALSSRTPPTHVNGCVARDQR